jgi:CHAT domain-containing protein
MVERGTNIERYLTAVTARDLELEGAREVEDTAQVEFAGSVEALCDWAWQAAMGPVVEPYLEADRVPHLVLIPMGDLARVPWQAARDPDGRYLVERVALSQAVSARMLCDTATAEPVPLTSAGLVVADPDTGGRAAPLPSARLEAYASRESFYPAATYLGRRPDGAVSNSGAGTPDEVRAWLRADGTAAGTMLHLASHAVMNSELERASSRLVLAGGDLTANELIDVLGNSGHRISLAVLAACHTGRSVYGYDEAYSLATMFLAAGVRSVLSTQWSVPDQHTSLLMYMFHHYLVTERRSPRDALRRAQIWMLDDARTPPDRMPPSLRHLLRESNPAQVPAWAGFVHWGQ